MHILIGLITAITGLLFALEHHGIDIGWINPWAWRRKRKWLKKYRENPAFTLDNPMDAAALLLTAVAKIDGDLSLEEKAKLKQIFEEEFKQDSRQASQLLSSSVYLLGIGVEVFDRPKDVLAPSLDKFTSQQKKSTLDLLKKVMDIGGVNPVQTDFVAKIKDVLTPSGKDESW